MKEYNLKAVERLTGLTADTIRAWEKRYQAVVPSRSENGRRVYSDEEVKRLSFLSELVSGGHSISKIANHTDKELISIINKTRPMLESKMQSNLESKIEKELNSLFAAVDQFDLNAVRFCLARLRFEVSPKVFVFDLIVQIMYWIGKRIVENKLSISQEHALSEAIRMHLTEIYESIEGQDGTLSPQKSLLFCTRDGDPHDFGLWMSAIMCRYAGYKTNYIGKSLPAESLVEAVEKLKPYAVVIGASAIPLEEQKITITNFIKEIDSKMSSKVEFWIGGAGLTNFKRPNTKRTIWTFEKIDELKDKI